jgi:Arc/MetJ-type ribon-helix-helix transcriptional regulator
MVNGMATRKVTVTVDERDLEAIRALVASGEVANVSAFIQHAVRVSLRNDDDFDALLATSLEASGGPMTDEERRWAEEMLGVKSQPRRTRTPAA